MEVGVNPGFMKILDVLCIVGARPQFIKHKPVLMALKQRLQVETLHTGQHFDVKMSEQFFQELEIPRPDFQAPERHHSGRHGEETAAMMVYIERVLYERQPRAVLVYGDTNSTLAGALVAVKQHIPIFHVEAGLRSFDRRMPEEVNRVLTDHVSTLLFAPTDVAVANLKKEGLVDRVYQVGDVMCDVLRSYDDTLGPVREGPYVLATVHRPANADDPERMRRILEVLDAVPYPVVFPLHPRTRKALERGAVSYLNYPTIEFVEPLSYLESLALQKFAHAIVTDSGGMQKEAYLLERPCFTLRSQTEWIETLAGGCNVLLGDDLESLPSLLGQHRDPRFAALYGDGYASERIAECIVDFLQLKDDEA